MGFGGGGGSEIVIYYALAHFYPWPFLPSTREP